MTYRFGTGVLVPFPSTDQSASKQRPVVVVSSAAYHAARADLIIMAITSQLRPGAFDVVLDDGAPQGCSSPRRSHGHRLAQGDGLEDDAAASHLDDGAGSGGRPSTREADRVRVIAAYAEGLNILRNANANVGKREQAKEGDAETSPLHNPEFYQYEMSLPEITEVWRRGSVIGSWLLDLTAMRNECSHVASEQARAGDTAAVGHDSN